MALKRCLNDDEKIGLTEEEVKLAEKWLRKHKTAGAIKDPEAMQIYDMLLLGATVLEIHAAFPRWPVGQIALTIALRKWMQQRDTVIHSVKTSASTRLAKSVLDSVNFLTSMLAVANAEHLLEMQNYIRDPENNPKPALRVKSLKEYKEILDSLQKLVTSGTNKPSLMDSVPNSEPTGMIQASPTTPPDEGDEVAALMAEVMDDE